MEGLKMDTIELGLVGSLSIMAGTTMYLYRKNKRLERELNRYKDQKEMLDFIAKKQNELLNEVMLSNKFLRLSNEILRSRIKEFEYL